MESVKKELVLSGIPASPGVAIGTALVFGGVTPKIEKCAITEADIPAEELRFHEALEKTRAQLLEIQELVQNELDDNEARIFDAHLLIIDDQALIAEVKDIVSKELVSSDYAFNKIIQRYITAMSKISDPYIRERGTDIQDVANRVIVNYHGLDVQPLSRLPGQRIIVSQDLKPSDTAALDRENAQAFATETGSRTSHAAIMARSMKIPAVVAVKPGLSDIRNGDIIIVDGYAGSVIANPTADTLKAYAKKEAKDGKIKEDLLTEIRLRPETIDGFRVQLAANIELPEDVADAKHYGAAGIGLYRTEYMFLNRTSLPDEEEQYNIYKTIVKEMENQTVVIRTLDLGGDKLSEIINFQKEANPFLGYRAIRLCLGHPQIFLTQLRALLRAGAHGDIKIMIPMIACTDEVEQTLELIADAKNQLRQKKLSFNENMEVGIMIETPSAAMIANHLARKVAFFSIGTNDLVQYTLAVDRNSERMAYLYQPSHPSILTLIKQVTDAARANGIWVSVCGEMASDPRFTSLLMGVGVHELSMSPLSIPPIRRLIRKIRMYEAEDVVNKCLKCAKAGEALELAENFLRTVAPDIFSLTTFGSIDE